MANVYYIPNGVKNLKLLFPALDWDNIVSFYTETFNADTVVMATSPLNVVEEACEDTMILHFQNYLGAIDSVPFKKINVENDSKSESIQSTVTNPLVKNVHALNRGDVRANEFYRGEFEFDEVDMDWLMELYNSPNVWLEWVGIQGQTDDYLPVVILDSKVQKYKREERFSYVITIDFALSHEKITLRG